MANNYTVRYPYGYAQMSFENNDCCSFASVTHGNETKKLWRRETTEENPASGQRKFQLNNIKNNAFITEAKDIHNNLLLVDGCINISLDLGFRPAN